MEHTLHKLQTQNRQPPDNASIPPQQRPSFFQCLHSNLRFHEVWDCIVNSTMALLPPGLLQNLKLNNFADIPTPSTNMSTTESATFGTTQLHVSIHNAVYTASITLVRLVNVQDDQ